jgi:hypothetical protein
MQNLQVFAWLIGLSPIRGSLNAYNAAISFIALTGVGAGIPSLLIRLGWFIYSVKMCKKGGIK